MSEYKTLFDFDNTWKATRITVDRDLGETQIKVTVTLCNGERSEIIEFINPYDPAIINEFIDFSRLIVEQELDTKRDFSTIRVEIWEELNSEYWCDEVNYITAAEDA